MCCCRPGDQLVRPKLTLDDCLAAFTASELVEQFFSTAINGKTTASKRTRFGTLPKYLLLQLKKFTLRADWTCVKLDVCVDMPDELDLTCRRGCGLQPSESPLPDVTNEVTVPPMDEEVLSKLVQMGFNVESCKRALFFTKNSGLELALQWLMDHIADSDFNHVFVPPGTGPFKPAKADQFVADPASVEQLMAMGFSEVQVKLALKETDNNLERAAEFIFTNPAKLEALEASSIGVEQMQQDDESAAPPPFDHKGSSK